jgi:hypothetical protein
VGFVVSACDFTIVEHVGGNAIIPDHGGAGANQQTIAANLRTINRKAVACAIGEIGNHRVFGGSKFMLPGRADFGYYSDAAYFPIIGGFCPERGVWGQISIFNIILAYKIRC